MDNTPFLPDRLEDEESAALVSIAEAAAMGARNAVRRGAPGGRGGSGRDGGWGRSR